MGPQAALVLLLTVAAVAAGFVRELATAAVYGTSAVADAFAVVLLYVEGVYALMINSVAAQVLVPLFVNADARDHAEKRQILWGLVVWVGVLGVPLAVLAALGSDDLARVLAPGFSPSQAAALRPLVVVIIPTGMLVAASGILTGGLRAESEFGWPLLGRAAYSLATAACVFTLGRSWGAWAGAAGLLLGALLLFGCQWWRLHAIGWTWTRPRMRHTHLAHFLRLAWPILAAALLLFVFMGGAQRAIASDLPTGAFAVTNYAQRLLSLAGLLTTSLYAVAATDLAAQFREGGPNALRHRSVEFFMSLSFLLAPLTVAIMVLSRLLVATAFERGSYLAPAVTETAWSLWLFALSLVPAGISSIAQVTFTAAGRPRLVLTTSAVMVAATLGLTWWLKSALGAAALAAAYSGGTLAFVVTCLVVAGPLLEGGAVARFCRYLARLGLRVVVALALPLGGLLAWKGADAARVWMLGGAGATAAISGTLLFLVIFAGLSWWSRDAGLSAVAEVVRATRSAIRDRLGLRSGAVL